jgi:putative membrane protein insertion efficiency factor
MRDLITLPLRWLIVGYRYTLSPFFGPCCRFHPTCSQYALEALREHGPWRGGWLTLQRLGKCHPWHPGGVDEVPLSCRSPHAHQR